jgi:DcaP outer membrane protein
VKSTEWLGKGTAATRRCCLGVGALLALVPLAGARGQSQSEQIEQLKATTEQMQKTLDEQARKIQALEKQTAAAPAVVVIPPLVVEEERPETFIVDKQTPSPKQKLAPRPDNATPAPPAASTLPAAKAGFWTIPGTTIQVRFGGDVLGVFIVSSKLMGATEWFVTSSIPVSGQDFSNSGFQVTGTANQSDLNFEIRVPTPVGSLRVVYRNDFAQPSSPAFTYDLKDFYVQAANLLVGYTESAFADVDAQPATLDYEGPNSEISYRHFQVRYVLKVIHSLTSDLLLNVALENAATEISVSAGTPRSVAPAGVVSLRMEGKPGHLQLATLLRALGSQTSSGQSQTVFGWGLSVTGNLNLWGADFLSLQVAGGQGVAAYFNDTGGLGLDAVDNANGQLTALSIFGTFVGFTHNWAARWNSTASYGYLVMDTLPYATSLGTGAFRRSQYASLNLVYQPWTHLLVGVEGLWGYNQTVSGASGQAWRGQMNLQFTF